MVLHVSFSTAQSMVVHACVTSCAICRLSASARHYSSQLTLSYAKIAAAEPRQRLAPYLTSRSRCAPRGVPRPRAAAPASATHFNVSLRHRTALFATALASLKPGSSASRREVSSSHEATGCVGAAMPLRACRSGQEWSAVVPKALDGPGRQG